MPLNLLAECSLGSFQKSLSVLTENKPAESWTILHAAEVFDSVSRNEAATIEERQQENTDGAEGTDEAATEQEI